ncbi:MAG: hypothetical protein H6841_03565 [Planctomycetes bacterium]|nr:hypothetical protein [Planctomycetota bacterium]MCB9934198.1 hypothetical protein [Planctomycetota bacterium]
MITVSRLVTCEKVGARRPHSLWRVRRAWRSPPEQLGIYVEFHRPDETQEFDWFLRIWRGSNVVVDTEVEMELGAGRFVESTYNFSLLQAEAKTYRIEVVLDGVPVASTVIDFGDPEALP